MSRGTKDLIRSAAPTAARGNGAPLQQGAEMQPQPPASGMPRPGVNQQSQQQQPGSNAAAPASTADLVTQLKSKLDVQRRELDERTDNVNAIQRNFQRLSEMYAGDRTRIAQLEEELAKMTIELESLRAEKKLFTALKSDFIVLQKTLNEERDAHATAMAAMKASLTAEQKKGVEALSEVALLRTTVEAAGRQSSDAAEMQERLSSVVTQVEIALVELLQEVQQTQHATGLVKPVLGAGITTIDTKNAARADPETRLCVAVKALLHCASNAFAPIRRVVDELANRHMGSLDDAVEAHKAETDRLRSAEAAALAKAKELQQQLTATSEKLKEAQKLWTLDRTTLQDKLTAQKAEFERQIQALEARCKAAEAAGGQSSTLIANLEAELAAVRLELSRVQEDLREARASRDAALSNANEGVASLTAAISNTAAELSRERELTASLRRDVDRLRAMHEEEVTRGRLAASAHAEALSKLRDERDRLVATIATLEQTVASLTAQCVALERRVQVLTEQQEALDAASQQLARVTALEREVERLQHELNVKQNELLNAKMVQEDTDIELMRVRTELDEMRRLAARSDSGASDRAAAAEKALAAEVATRKKVESEFEALKLVVKALTEEARKAKEGEQRASALHLAASAEVASTQRELAQIKVSLAAATESKAMADGKCDALQRRLNSVEMELGVTKNALERAGQVQDDSKARSQLLTERMMQVQAWAEEIKALQRESIKTVKKVLAAEEACESGYSCASCLEVMKNPVVCAPCGHAYCRSCFTDANKATGGAKGASYCPECQETHVTHVMPSKNLDLLAGKFDFRKRALKELSTTLEKTFAGLEAQSAS